jgi:hypothetical protein
VGVKTRSLTVHIDELVLEGVVADADRIRAAVERELGRLLEQGTQSVIDDGTAHTGGDAESIGGGIARSLHGRLEP